MVRALPTSAGLGACKFIDTIDVDQCVHMTDGLTIVDFIPSSLHEEWSDAWNCVYRFRQSAIIQDDKAIALKWIMWLPQGLLHTPSRGGKDGLR
jgi:hypothetical protein